MERDHVMERNSGVMHHLPPGPVVFFALGARQESEDSDAPTRSGMILVAPDRAATSSVTQMQMRSQDRFIIPTSSFIINDDESLLAKKAL